MRFSTLDDWLAWQETLHPRDIDLGLERVAAVADVLGLRHPSCVVITVAGTNGKGSSVALLAAVLAAAGFRVGRYTSPHLLRYNERINIAGRAVDDAALCGAFARIDAARGPHSLTYFEFGTLAALDLFARADLDVMLLEVGLGGRLDAVNIIDPDVALISAVDIDHVAWLGNDRETIGAEKAGIFRTGRAAVCGDPTPPDSVRARAREVQADWYGRDAAFAYRRARQGWDWIGAQRTISDLPLPALAGDHQLDNAAAVVQALECLQQRLPVDPAALAAGLLEVSLPGRLQRLPGTVERVLDVAHNAQGARALAQALADWPCAGRTLMVLGMLDDKDCAAFVQPLRDQVDHWFLCGLDAPRGLGGSELAARVALPAAQISVMGPAAEAYQAAMTAARAGDRVVVGGSFHTLAGCVAAGALAVE